MINMSSYLKVATVVLILNLFLFFGINYANIPESNNIFNIQGDIFDIFLDDSINQAVDYERTGNINLTGNINITSGLSTQPFAEGGEQIGDGGISVVDGLKIFFSIIPTLWNIALSPLNLLTIYHIPLMIRLLIGLPLTFMMLISIFLLIRGIG